MIWLFTVILSFYMIQNDNPLKNYQWKNRIVVLYGESALVKEQMEVYEKNLPGVIDRDMLIFYNDGEDYKIYPEHKTRDINYSSLILYYQLKKPFTSLLIGKDGSIKKRNENILPKRPYFDIIDAMPMRQREIRNGQGSLN